jgi:hypothetical protein
MPVLLVDFNPTCPIRSTQTWTLNVHTDVEVAKEKTLSPVDFWAEMTESVVDMAESAVEATESLWLAGSRGSNGKGAGSPARTDDASGEAAPAHAVLTVTRIADFSMESRAFSPVRLARTGSPVHSGARGTPAADQVVEPAAPPASLTVDQRTFIEARRRRWVVAIAVVVIGLGVLLCVAAVLLGASGHNGRPSVQRPFPPASTVSLPYHVVLPGVPHSDRAAVATGAELGSVRKNVAAREELPRVSNDRQAPSDATITPVRRRLLT